MNWAAVVWFALMVLFLLVEVNTVSLVSVWFIAGALVAMIASLLGAQVWLQSVLFFAVLAVLLLALRPTLKKHVTPKLVKTNVDAIIGTEGIVTATIDNLSATGQVKLGAMEWTARSTDGEVIEKGTVVQVNRIEGVKVFVTPVKVVVH